MTEHITEARLNELEALEKAASRRPWENEHDFSIALRNEAESIIQTIRDLRRELEEAREVIQKCADAPLIHHVSASALARAWLERNGEGE